MLSRCSCLSWLPIFIQYCLIYFMNRLKNETFEYFCACIFEFYYKICSSLQFFFYSGSFLYWQIMLFPTKSLVSSLMLLFIFYPYISCLLSFWIERNLHDINSHMNIECPNNFKSMKNFIRALINVNIIVNCASGNPCLFL